MGMYTGIRFKGYIKEEFRQEFKPIALEGGWKDSSDDVFKKFGELDRSSFIPCGGLSYMPDNWETDYIDDHGNKIIEFDNYHMHVATDGFELHYDDQTGYWAFQCSLKNYEDEIEQFFEIMPYFIQSLEHLEYYYEEWECSQRYELIDGKVVMTDNRFKRYR